MPPVGVGPTGFVIVDLGLGTVPYVTLHVSALVLLHFLVRVFLAGSHLCAPRERRDVDVMIISEVGMWNVNLSIPARLPALADGFFRVVDFPTYRQRDPHGKEESVECAGVKGSC